MSDEVNQVVITKNVGRIVLREASERNGDLLLSVFDGTTWTYLRLGPAESGALRVFLNSFLRDRNVVDDLKEWTGE